MTDKEKRKARDIDKRLKIIKNRDNEIREAVKFYCAARPDLTKDGTCQDIAEKTGLSKTTVWDIVRYGSIYEKKGITTL